MYKLWPRQAQNMYMTILTFIWPLWHWPSTYLKMFQMALLLLEGNNCAKLFWNPCIIVQVMVRTNPDGRTHIHRMKIVTTMSRLPASGLEKNNEMRWKCIVLSCQKRALIKNGPKCTCYLFNLYPSLSLSDVQVFRKFLKHQLRSPGSSVGSALAYWSSAHKFEPNSRRNLLNRKRVPLRTCSGFAYHLPIVLIWLKYYWKGRKIASRPSIHPSQTPVNFLSFYFTHWL